ncbi:hypothetical protein [Anaerobutyricum hallii]|uniref:hypothetical protein n=1 Tax=Anaerobutyricum hallii TaxID=39488 RepID=UPI003A86A897
MKKILGLLLSTILVFGMCGCETAESINASTATEATTEAFDEEGSDIEYYTLGDITFPIPSTWTLTKNDDSYAYYFCPTNNVEDHTPILMICLISLDDVSTSLIRNESDSVFDAIFKGFNEGGELTISTKKDLDGYSEYPGKYISGTEMINDTHYVFESYLTLYDTNCYNFQLSIPKDAKNTYSDDLEQIVAATTYNNESEDSDDDDYYYDDSSNDTEYEDDDTETEENETVSYQSILDDYTQKLKDATPGLVKEYKSEAAGKSGDTEALASLCNDKVGELAKICNDGVGEMTRLMHSNGDSYDTYEEWAGKLQDAYSDQASKIQDAYLDSAT